MISRGHHCRGTISTCISRAMSHSQPCSAAIIHLHDAQKHCTDRHARTISINHSSSSYQMERIGSCNRIINRSNFNHSFFSTFTKSAYIHPLSQIVLEHLQSSHGHWVQRVGLDTGLKLNEDGTFILHFPSAADDDDDVVVEAAEGKSSEEKTSMNGSIWTMYEPEEKKHFLCVTKGGLVGRYMLQDNKQPAWHSNEKSTPELVQDAVDGMIEKLEEV